MASHFDHAIAHLRLVLGDMSNAPCTPGKACPWIWLGARAFASTFASARSCVCRSCVAASYLIADASDMVIMQLAAGGQ
jgi:hypothetical protein